MKTVKWECPKCGNKKAVYHGKTLGTLALFLVKRDPGCQNCGLKRFSQEYGYFLKQKNNAPVAQGSKASVCKTV